VFSLALPRRSQLLSAACRYLRSGILALVAAALSLPATAKNSSVYLEEMTWTEASNELHAGKTTVIIPVGATEQSGPHIALGKHNVRARYLAGKIAAALGNALVAPVIAYVPEGSIHPPAGHMRFTGTISVSDEAFKGILDGAARSFRQHGFTDIVLIGDHGGYQAQLKAVATKLNQDWAGSNTHALYVADYYRAADVDFAQALRAKGLSNEQIGLHAGTADTALTLAVDASLVRPEQMPHSAEQARAEGVNGDPRPATAALGQLGIDLIVSKSVAAIRAGTAKH
jgi:creatinine amidohydrolase/Fe(II)-dependent formamide hydrolase-like protein